VLGWFADMYGRRTSLMFASMWAFWYGILCFATPSYQWLAVLRMLLGFGVGGLPQAVTYFTEFMPNKVNDINNHPQWTIPYTML